MLEHNDQQCYTPGTKVYIVDFTTGLDKPVVRPGVVVETRLFLHGDATYDVKVGRARWTHCTNSTVFPTKTAANHYMHRSYRQFLQDKQADLRSRISDQERAIAEAEGALAAMERKVTALGQELSDVEARLEDAPYER